MDEASRTVSALGALAHEHRLALFRLLVERGPDGLAAGEIAARLGSPRGRSRPGWVCCRPR